MHGNILNAAGRGGAFGYFQPGGGLAIDRRHGLARDLAYCRVMDSFAPSPLFTRAPQVESINNGGIIRAVQSGVGWGGTNGGSNPCFFNPSNQFGVGTFGSLFAFVHQAWSPSDSLSHCVATLGQNNGDTVRELMLLKYATNNWYAGFYDGTTATEYRAITAAAGLTAAGQSYSVGLTWQLGGTTTFYVKGASANTHASPAAPFNVAHDYFVLGALGVYSNSSWGSSDNSVIHYVAIWDRILSASEIALLAQQPWCFLRKQPLMPPGGLLPDDITEIGAGFKVATDDDGSRESQFVKPAWGPNATYTKITEASGKPLPAQARSHTGLVPWGEPTDAKDAEVGSGSVSAISLFKQISAYLQRPFGGGSELSIDPYWNNVVFLSNFEGADGATSITDQTGRHSVAMSGALTTGTRISNLQAEYGATSLRAHNDQTATGSGNLADFNLSAANSDQYTIEWSHWADNLSGASCDPLSQFGSPGFAGWLIRTQSTTLMTFYWSPDSSALISQNFAASLVSSTWAKWCFEKNSGGKMRLYKNGVMQDSFTPANSIFFPSTATLSLKPSVSGAAGYLDNVRITKGIARYNNDAGYAPATSEFPTNGIGAVGPNQTDQVLGTTGQTGDYLVSVTIVPLTTSPGAVSIKDGSGSAITLFAGGDISATALMPIVLHLGMRSSNGAWKMTTGANVSALISIFSP